MRDSFLFIDAIREGLQLRNGIFPLVTDLNIIVGTTPTLIQRPADADESSFLVLHSEAGTWRMRPGRYLPLTPALVNPSNNNIAFGAPHNYITGDGPIRLTASVMPTGLAGDTDYWVIDQADTILALATSRQNALDGVPVTFSTAGTAVEVAGPADGTVGDGWGNAAAPAATVQDGYSSFALLAGERMVLPAPSLLTVVGFNANDELSYFFV